MVVVHDTPSECALQMYEVWSKYLLQFLSYRADTILWQTDRRKGKNNMSPQSFTGWGDIITVFNLYNYEMLKINDKLYIRLQCTW